MMKRWAIGVLLIVWVLAVFSCRKEEETADDPVEELPDTGVKFDLSAVPYQKLSDYRFFTGDMKLLNPNSRVLPYEPITPLFSDYAHKKRFIWMPQGVSASYVADGEIFNFPDGTVMIKNFYYDHVLPNDATRNLETRLIYKKDGAWYFADYIWNEDQTEAFYSLEGENVELQWVDDDGEEKYVNFRIPSEVECHTCHKSNMAPIPIGPKPQNINKDFAYADGVKNQIAKWQEAGYLSGNVPENIMTTVDYKDLSQPVDLRLRSYLDANCSYCHNEPGHCGYRQLRLAFNMTEDEENMGVCVPPDLYVGDQYTYVIARSNILRSAMHLRMNTNDAELRMPMFGRSMVHEEGVALLEEYIQSLTPICTQ
jgi:uncharacterized repeat protein (TIGR03806 family)